MHNLQPKDLQIINLNYSSLNPPSNYVQFTPPSQPIFPTFGILTTDIQTCNDIFEIHTNMPKVVNSSQKYSLWASSTFGCPNSLISQFENVKLDVTIR